MGLGLCLAKDGGRKANIWIVTHERGGMGTKQIEFLVQQAYSPESFRLIVWLLSWFTKEEIKNWVHKRGTLCFHADLVISNVIGRNHLISRVYAWTVLLAPTQKGPFHLNGRLRRETPVARKTPRLSSRRAASGVVDPRRRRLSQLVRRRKFTSKRAREEVIEGE